MTTYRAIADTETDPQAPITAALMKAFQNNVLAIAERDATAPDIGLAIALSGAGTVGSYAFLTFSPLTAASPGSTHAGSGLRYANAVGSTGGTPSGTWRLMGVTGSSNQENSTSLFLRIS